MWTRNAKSFKVVRKIYESNFILNLLWCSVNNYFDRIFKKFRFKAYVEWSNQSAHGALMIFDHRRKLTNFHNSFSRIIFKLSPSFKMQFNEYNLFLCLTIQNSLGILEIATFFYSIQLNLLGKFSSFLFFYLLLFDNILFPR